MNAKRLIQGLFATVLALAAISVGAQETRLLEPEDLFEIKAVGSPEISPDGAWVAYTVRTTSLEDDSSETRIWMASTADDTVLPMSGPGSSASSPQWSPDGRFLSFLASRNEGRTQVWALDRRGGEARQLTHVEQGVNDFAWSPDASRLALVIRDPEEDDDELRPWVIDRLQFKRDYAGYLDRRRTHLYVQDVAPGEEHEAVQITSGDYDDSQPAWSPDGRLIAFVSNRTEEPDANSNSDIWVVAADNPDAGATLLQVTTNPGSDYSPAWSPDGSQIAHVTVTEPDLIWYATGHLAVSPATGGPARVLSARLDRNVGSPRFAPDGETILFVLEDSAERHLASMDTSGENFSRLIDGPLSLRGYSQSDDGQLATLISEPHLPAEVFYGTGAGRRQLTFTNQPWLDELQLAEVENVQFDNPGGTEIEGFLVKPPGFDQTMRYPTLLRIHGGPVAQYDFAFNFEAQLFAANGYLVVMTNPRGSSGYGQDFSHALWANWGVPDTEDVIAGVDHAIEIGYADPDRLGVGGWSYGGILTNYVITKSDRFKGAITGASEVLYRANYGHDHYQRQWEAELGLPWENAEAWERITPFNDVANVVTPTLIMGGEHDWNVPIQNSEQLYQALRRLGVETQLVVYPNEFHGISKPAFQLDRLERYLAWYDKYVKGAQ
ncbi:MAG: S9 family peptidase [Gammaproteobacteria bacterium]|nr:S9 family peptidase [Gammaproteobacteria bacterium]MYF01098.1 S9 family peptidase [Gammaproteobacteria bacterium]